MSEQNLTNTSADQTTEETALTKTDAGQNEERSSSDGDGEALRSRYLPRVDVLETPDAFRLTADVPGASEDGLELTVEKDVLTLWAKVPDGPLARRDRDSLTTRGNGYPEGDWHRTFRLGQTVDRDGVEAELSRGVLTVTLPKAKEQLRRTIAVKTVA
ncbi:Hsp20/alpha crystallin family protein [Alienimonas californiensis]|uniref:18 kDa heat shock protein n=1 Tax=Alienimonas californiensis TaxID=2527989 RepID=A0A517PAA5_9PLAN|nr:Hsp20/alpha crystallin family protein [Alienimonas californiensis]QDT16295.1 18 kDa heat shock protein [Alienimonas californiensis]